MVGKPAGRHSRRRSERHCRRQSRSLESVHPDRSQRKDRIYGRAIKDGNEYVSEPVTVTFTTTAENAEPVRYWQILDRMLDNAWIIGENESKRRTVPVSVKVEIIHNTDRTVTFNIESKADRIVGFVPFIICDPLGIGQSNMHNEGNRRQDIRNRTSFGQHLSALQLRRHTVRPDHEEHHLRLGRQRSYRLGRTGINQYKHRQLCHSQNRNSLRNKQYRLRRSRPLSCRQSSDIRSGRQ